MADHKTYKLVEIVGTSGESFAEAAASGVERASKTLRHLDWFEVTELRGRVTDGKISQYQVKMKVGFRLDD
jgi:flavin-binding protein dodecin